MHDTVVPLAIGGALHGAIREASQQLALSQAEVMRQSIRIGLPRLRAAMAAARNEGGLASALRLPTGNPRPGRRARKCAKP